MSMKFMLAWYGRPSPVSFTWFCSASF